MKIEITPDQQKVLLVIINKANITGADSEFIAKLKATIQDSIIEEPKEKK